MIHNFWNDSQFGINPSFWSIAVEAQLYLIYPILLLLQRLFGWKTTLVIALFFEFTLKQGASILSLHGIVMPQTLTKGPFAYWCSWSIGAWMADKYKRRSALNWPRSLSPIACITLVLATWIYKPISPLEFFAAALLSASVIAWKLTPIISEICTTSRRNIGIEDRILVNLRSHLAFIGIISYSLYLLHQPIISLMNKLLTLAPIYRELPTLLQYFTLLVVTLIVSLPSAYVFHVLIERTSISWGKQLWRRLSYKNAT
jgi:peptidoglycan/LPS O-acetylase OafA/YrhL